jgi:superfamily II DNA or RNA helicase
VADAPDANVSTGDVKDLLEQAAGAVRRLQWFAELARARQQAVPPLVDDLQGELVVDQLATIPIATLAEITKGRVRIGLLEQAGLDTVADVLSGRENLEYVQGVGPETARQVRGAAQQLKQRLQAETPIRLDPERRLPEATSLLRALRALDDVPRDLAARGDEAADVATHLNQLSHTASRARSKLRMLFSGGATRDAARAAVAALARTLADPSTAALLDAIDAATPALADPVTDSDELWADFAVRAAAYYARLGDLADTAVARGAAQGYLPEDVVAAVEAQELDTSLLTASLRGYQDFGARFALVQGRTILGDEMGLGKTVEALAVMAHLAATGSTHFLVVCPASVLVNWQLEVAKHTELTAVEIHGGDRGDELAQWQANGGVAVTTYDSLRLLPVPPDSGTEGTGLPRVDLLVADEAHYVKNPSAQRSQATKAWAAVAGRVLFLSGTPMENRVDEFKVLVGYLQPAVAATVGAIDGLAGAAAFRRSVAPVYLRRNQQDVLHELPERIEMEDWVPLGPDEQARYAQAVAAGNIMLMRRAAFTGGTPERSPKVDRLVDLLEETRDDGWKAVVFTFFLDVVETVRAVSPIPVFGPITGAVPPAERQRIIDAFTAHGEPAVLVSQIQAGGVGLNIQTASVVVLCEPQWKPSTEEQAIARCHRMGQTRRVHVHRLLTKDAVDEQMLELLATKTQLFDEYARRSDLKEASDEAVDVSEAAAIKEVITRERARLGFPVDAPIATAPVADAVP